MSKDHVSDPCSALIYFPLAIVECAGLSSMRVAKPAATRRGFTDTETILLLFVLITYQLMRVSFYLRLSLIISRSSTQ
jgi:hypothetical protein